jgi:DNA-binding response OmpR family regulator
MDYSFFTFWKLMHKTAICLLSLMLVVCGTALAMRIKKAKKEKTLAIDPLPNGDYYIGSVLVNVVEKKLISGKREVKIAGQPLKLLMMFLQNKHRRVKKEMIKETFWSQNKNAAGNMTSAIDRLKKTLTEADIPYTVVSKKGTDYYLLVAKDNTSIA